MVCFFHKFLGLIWSCLFEVLISTSGMVHWEWSIAEFALLFSSGGNPKSGTCKFFRLRVGQLGSQLSLSWDNPINRAENLVVLWVGVRLSIRLGPLSPSGDETHQQRGEPDMILKWGYWPIIRLGLSSPSWGGTYHWRREPGRVLK